MATVWHILVAIIGAAIGFMVGLQTVRTLKSRELEEAKRKAEEIVERARREAEAKAKEIVMAAREEAYRIQEKAEREAREKRKELLALEKKLIAREEQIDRRIEKLEEKETELAKKEEEIRKRLVEAEELKAKELEQLQRIAKLSREEAKKILLEKFDRELAEEKARKIEEMEKELEKTARQKAVEIVSSALQNVAVEVVNEITTTTVELPNDDMKGRIIGREGRNIRTFEMKTGVDLNIDDTPDVVVLSCFNPERRWIAKVALERLVKDGRIHPARIEEEVERAKMELPRELKKIAEQAMMELGVHQLHPELVLLIGRLYLRHVRGINLLRHSVEVAKIASAIAAELGLNPDIVRRAGLLHDIGRAILDAKGPHAVVGAAYARRFGEKDIVVHPIEAHHGNVKPKTVEAVILQVADTLAFARPGAKREEIERYIKRLENLERIARGFEGIKEVYVVQAGREVRIIVKPEAIPEAKIPELAHRVAREIEKEMTYPGEIKVNVIREVRAVDFAR